MAKIDIEIRDYIDLWKTWNRFVWYTPVAFLSILSVLGAVLKFILGNKSNLLNEIGFSSHIVIGTFFIGIGATLFCCVMVLYRFALRRELVASFIRRNFEHNNGLFKIWADMCHSWQGLDFVSVLISSVAVFFFLTGLRLLLFIEFLSSHQEIFVILSIIISFLLGILATSILKKLCADKLKQCETT